jgi:hypothetical protein
MTKNWLRMRRSSAMAKPTDPRNSPWRGFGSGAMVHGEPPLPAVAQPSPRDVGSPPCTSPAPTTRWKRVPS